VIVAWRLIKAKHRESAFSGEGALKGGGRWNQQGTAVVYVSGSLALAALEAFIHLQRAAAAIPHVAFRVEIPENVVDELHGKDLPKNWRVEPPPDTTKQIGTDWVKASTSAVLRVPSVIVPAEHNFVLNPAHPDFKKLHISKPEPFSFDPRMWK